MDIHCSRIQPTTHTGGLPRPTPGDGSALPQIPLGLPGQAAGRPARRRGPRFAAHAPVRVCCVLALPRIGWIYLPTFPGALTRATTQRPHSWLLMGLATLALVAGLGTLLATPLPSEGDLALGGLRPSPLDFLFGRGGSGGGAEGNEVCVVERGGIVFGSSYLCMAPFLIRCRSIR